MLEPTKWQIIAGRYRLDQEIARGGMGSVWSGHDKKLRRRVAIKLVAPDWSAASDARTRFEREAMAVAQLQSPHVVQIFDYGVDKLRPFIVMELLEGEDLRTRLHRLKRLTLDSAAQLLVQCAKALSAAHAAGIIHRDLKPGNIFLVRQGDEELVKILDFGVAKQLSTSEPRQRGDAPVLGTPQFMSPEQARGLPGLDHRTDLWALGVIIYRALTGRLPFHAATPTEVIVKVCTEQPELVSRLAPDLPHELDVFFSRALARDRDHRFESARQMALAFSRISPITFTTLSMPDPGPAIEEAMRHAAVALESSDEEDAATVAVDGLASVPLWADEPDDEQTNVAGSQRGAPGEASAAPSLPAPRPPPRRTTTPITARGAGVTPPQLPSRRRPLGPPPAPGIASPPPAPPPPEPPLSTPVLLTRPSDGQSPPPARSSAPPSAALRPSHPTLQGGVMEQPRLSAPPPDQDGSTRPTLLLALAAVLIGVIIAVIGSAVADHSIADREAAARAAQPAEGVGDTGAAAATAEAPPSSPGADGSQDSSAASSAPSNETAEEIAGHGDDQTGPSGHHQSTSARPKAGSAHRPKTHTGGAKAVARPTPPPAAKSKPPTPPHTTPAPPATKPPAGGEDPFADRL